MTERKEIRLIGTRYYNYLKSKETLTQEEKEAVENYDRIHSPTPEQIKKSKSYFDKIKNPVPEKKEYNPTAEQLYYLFIDKFKEIEGEDWIKNKMTVENLKPVLFYFSKDERFFDCENLIKEFEFDGKIRSCKPSFKKSLMLVGNYGNGKTTTMKVMYHIIKPNERFRYFTVNQIIQHYESLSDPSQKASFWKLMKSNNVYFDDVKSERDASNFGKINIFKEILEIRYAETGEVITPLGPVANLSNSALNEMKTHQSCNYKKGFEGDVNIALLEYGEKYGDRVFDRIFQMCNVIEFKGKSFRR